MFRGIEAASMVGKLAILTASHTPSGEVHALLCLVSPEGNGDTALYPVARIITPAEAQEYIPPGEER